MTEALETAAPPARETQADYLRRLRAEAKDRGDCSVCRARPARPGLETCTECGQRWKATRAGWRKRKKCSGCGGKRKRGRKQCAACLARDRAYNLTIASGRRAAGLCRCGAERAPNRKHCSECLDYMLERQRVREGWLVRTQKCSVCGDADHTRRNHDRKVANAEPGYTSPEQIAYTSPEQITATDCLKKE